MATVERPRIPNEIHDDPFRKDRAPNAVKRLKQERKALKKVRPGEATSLIRSKLTDLLGGAGMELHQLVLSIGRKTDKAPAAKTGKFPVKRVDPRLTRTVQSAFSALGTLREKARGNALRGYQETITTSIETGIRDARAASERLYKTSRARMEAFFTENRTVEQKQYARTVRQASMKQLGNRLNKLRTMGSTVATALAEKLRPNTHHQPTKETQEKRPKRTSLAALALVSAFVSGSPIQNYTSSSAAEASFAQQSHATESQATGGQLNQEALMPVATNDTEQVTLVSNPVEAGSGRGLIYLLEDLLTAENIGEADRDKCTSNLQGTYRIIENTPSSLANKVAHVTGLYTQEGSVVVHGGERLTCNQDGLTLHIPGEEPVLLVGKYK